MGRRISGLSRRTGVILYLTIGARSSVYRDIDLSLIRLEAMMSRLILMITPSATEGQAGGQAAADSS
jgi:hypothetical protein